MNMCIQYVDKVISKDNSLQYSQTSAFANSSPSIHPPHSTIHPPISLSPVPDHYSP